MTTPPGASPSVRADLARGDPLLAREVSAKSLTISAEGFVTIACVSREGRSPPPPPPPLSALLRGLPGGANWPVGPLLPPPLLGANSLRSAP